MEEMNQDFVEIDLKEYFNILWDRKWIILGVAIFGPSGILLFKQ